MILSKSKFKKSKNNSKEKIVFSKDNKNDDLVLATHINKEEKDNLNNPKVNNKNKKNHDYGNEKKHKTKRLFFGLGKEFWRVTWPTNKKILNDFIISIILIAFFVLIFTGIGFLIGTFVN